MVSPSQPAKTRSIALKPNDAHVEVFYQVFAYQKDFYARHWVHGDQQGYSPVCSHGPKSQAKEFCKEAHNNGIGCLSCSNFKAVPLTKEIVISHLTSKETIGVYQLKDNTLSWLCFDIDDSGVYGQPLAGEVVRSEQQLGLIIAVLESKDIPFIVEESSPRSFHVWVLPNDPIRAKEARLFGEAILKLVNLSLKGKDHPDGIELFPKQTEAKIAGNLVKLPLGYNRFKKCWSRFLNPDTIKPIGDIDDQLDFFAEQVKDD